MTEAVTERPIIFSGPMVRAILEGRKTQTRRVTNPQPELDLIASKHSPTGFFDGDYMDATITNPVKCPFGAAGHKLWVREAWAPGDDMFKTHQCEPPEFVWFRADDSLRGVDRQNSATADMRRPRWRPSIHMPRILCRVVLRIVSIEPQRLQAITDDDCIDEGIDPETDPNWAHAEHMKIGGVQIEAGSEERHAFRCLWDGLNASRGFGWRDNPWVWKITFKRVK